MKVTARDVMQTDVVTITPDTGVEEAVELMLSNWVSGLPVVDSEGRLVGMVTEKDLLVLLYESLSDTEGESASITQLMTRVLITFKPDADILEVCKCLIDNSFRRVPIVDDGNKLLGLISRYDLMCAIMALRQGDEQEAAEPPGID